MTRAWLAVVALAVALLTLRPSAETVGLTLAAVGALWLLCVLAVAALGAAAGRGAAWAVSDDTADDADAALFRFVVEARADLDHSEDWVDWRRECSDA